MSALRFMGMVVCLRLVGPAVDAGDGPVQFTPDEQRRILTHAPLGPPPPDPTNRVADDPAAARLGQFLFFDPRLSANGAISCGSCHDPEHGFTSPDPVAVGLAAGRRNSLSLWNVGHQRWFYWDGRVDSLWAQALNPIENPVEMGGSRLQVAHLMHDDPQLRAAYEVCFGPLPPLGQRGRFPPQGGSRSADPADPSGQAWLAMEPADRLLVNQVFSNVGKALAAYERRLQSHQSAFDRFAEALRSGDTAGQEVLSDAAKRGMKLFVGRGNCRLCHSGPNFSDGEFHNIGVPPLHGGLPRDAGRYAGIDVVLADPFNGLGVHSDAPESATARKLKFLTNTPDNWGRFRTPSLRNVARTAPYMHQGQFKTLREVLQYYSTLEGFMQMAHHRETILVPLDLSDREADDLAAFLEALTDEGLPEGLGGPPPSPRFHAGADPN